MFVVYILLRNRMVKVKLVRDKSIFVYKGFEYRIDRSRIYQKKALGFKLFFWSMYLEGNPNPIEFDDPIRISDSRVPLDKIALLLNKLKYNLYMIIVIVVVVVNLMATIGLFYWLSENM